MNLFHFILIFNFGVIVSAIIISNSRGQSNDLDATIIFYFGPNLYDYKVYSFNEAVKILHHPQFDLSLSTTFFFHGYLENQTQPQGSARIITKAYLNSEVLATNLLVLDWATAVSGNYFLSAIPNEQTLGPILAQIILKLFRNGLNIRKFHIVGHSLGAQLAGLVGRNIKSLSSENILVARITGLDPAGIGFYAVHQTLNKNDGQFVDIIHTDAGLYGIPYSTGTVDFWPNRGVTLQPGCPQRNYQLFAPNDLCSHHRSYIFYAESVRGKYKKRFLASNMMREGPIQMGIFCPTNSKGDVYLTTNKNEPFAKGVKGIVYQNENIKTRYYPIANFINYVIPH